MEFTTQQKLKKKIEENCSPRAILQLLEHERTEAFDKLKKTKDESDFRFIQGQVYILDTYVELLSKVVS